MKKRIAIALRQIAARLDPPERRPTVSIYASRSPNHCYLTLTGGPYAR